MKIELTEEEFGALLDIAHIADVVLFGHRRKQDKRSVGHRALVQRIYSLAPDAGLGRLTTRHEGHGEDAHYAATEEFEGATLAHAALDEFSDHLFWDELIGRLSVRDAARTAGGMERLAALDDEAREAAEGPVRRRYVQEFSKHGLENIVVVEGFVAREKELVETSD